MATRIDDWLAAATADAEKRGLPELKPLLEGLARATTALRAADAELEASERQRASESHTPPEGRS
jgi:hypothetical protein